MSLLKSTLIRQGLRMGKENIITLGIIAFLAMSFLGLYSMPVDMSGKVMNCPFMNSSVNLCQMSLNDHINQWQQLFTVIRERSLFLLSLTLLVFMSVALFTTTARAYDKRQLQRSRNYLYQYKPEIKVFDYLILAFSQGIIHSKIYA